ncbi:MAG: TIGR01777 family oxidoreductase [Bdellovibrionota bacterium]|nr:TIGR01777 family oxidoreductase [Bdellovibrionota bacterium]
MKVLVTGATGFVGRKICRKLILAGHEIVITTRSKSRTQKDFPFPATIIEWDYSSQEFETGFLDGVDSVIHLMGESIADGRWTEKRKKRLYNSRIISTEKIVNAIHQSSSVKSFLSASAIGYYPLSDTEGFDETAKPGENFLAKICVDWEKASEKLPAHIRRCVFRLGMVLGHGGAMEKLENLFSYGITSPLGSGKQWMSWIAINDLVDLFFKALNDEAYEGVYNAVSPHPVNNKEFHKSLAKAFSRPLLPSTPGFILKVILGEMSQVVLGSQKVLPKRLLEQGFSFRNRTLDECFQAMYPHGAFTKVVEKDLFLEGHDLSVFDFFQDEKNLDQLTPEFLNFKVLGKNTPEIREGTEIYYRLKLNGIPFRWKTLIRRWEPPYLFVDTQESGPYQVWDHTHTFEATERGVMVSDKVYWKLPIPFISLPVAGFKVKSDVKKIFEFRKQKMEELFGR